MSDHKKMVNKSVDTKVKALNSCMEDILVIIGVLESSVLNSGSKMLEAKILLRELRNRLAGVM